MSDHDEIRNVIGTYARAVDRRDYAAIASCFTADAEASYSGLEFLSGVDSIVDHIKGVERTRMSQHFIHPIEIHVDGDEATCFSYAIAVLMQDKGGQDASVARGLSYDDRLRRGENGWRIYRRLHSADWSWELPVLIDPGAMWHADPGADQETSIYRSVRNERNES